MRTNAQHVARVVVLEWDRGHEELEALLRAETSHGVVLTEIFDLALQKGFRWLRRSEILSIRDVDASAPSGRLAQLHGWLAQEFDPSLTSLPTLLASFESSAAPLIAVYQSRTGSDECMVGSIATLTSSVLTIHELLPAGRFSGDTIHFDLAEIIGLEWSTAYLASLAELAAIEPDDS